MFMRGVYARPRAERRSRELDADERGDDAAESVDEEVAT
jgi:hypothetical protein